MLKTEKAILSAYVLLCAAQRSNKGGSFVSKKPHIADDLSYMPDPNGKKIRVYDSVDVRLIFEDMYAKLSLFAQ